MNIRTTFAWTAGTILGISLLAACSAFIPPQVIPNPIGISGRQVQVEIGASGALRTAAAGLGTVESSFSDFDTSSVPISLTLSQSLFKVGFAAKATLTTSASSLPCNIFLTRVDIVVTVSDALQTYTLPAFKVNKVIELEQQTDDLNSYKILTEDVFVGNAFSAEDVRKLQQLITTGGDNQVVAQVIIEATSFPELPPGSILALTFETSEATLTLTISTRSGSQALPMVPQGVGAADEDGNEVSPEAFDFTAIKAIKPLSDAAVLARAKAALEQAGLNPQGGNARIGHSRFEAVSVAGEVVTDVLLDTQIDFDTVTPNGYPLKGPGADIKIVFDGAGVVTQLHYAFRTLTEGSRAKALSLQQAERKAAADYFEVGEGQIALQGQCASVPGQLGTLCLEPELVYYAPPLNLAVSQILPHYLFSGNFVLGGQTINVRNLLVPAVENAPAVELAVTTDGVGAVQAQATVTGGRGPYQYAWSSSSTSLDLTEEGASLSYQVRGRETVERETLSLTVTDADGVSAWTSQAVTVNAPAATLSSQQASKLSVGAEWIGLSQNLPFASKNVGGFLQEAGKRGIGVAFNLGDDAAYQRDFAKDTDEFEVDSVDMTFYTGHANGLGFTFASERDRRFFYADQASWGENDLEWLVIAACGPLQETELGIAWWKQWGKAFNGLHLMLAYATVTYDNNREGKLLGQEIFDKGLALRQAWANTATAIQTPDEIYAVMGAWGADGLNNYNDHFWGLGPVGPDIPALDVEGYWRLSGPS